MWSHLLSHLIFTHFKGEEVETLPLLAPCLPQSRLKDKLWPINSATKMSEPGRRGLGWESLRAALWGTLFPQAGHQDSWDPAKPKTEERSLRNLGVKAGCRVPPQEPLPPGLSWALGLTPAKPDTSVPSPAASRAPTPHLCQSGVVSRCLGHCHQLPHTPHLYYLSCCF